MELLFDNFDVLAQAPDGVKKLREMILQLAVQGKLVPQDPNDEPASVLLEKIKDEKEKLIKEGIIKKQKPLEPIKDEEIPFDIPGGWVWTRLGECVSLKSGSSLPQELELVSGEVPYCKVGDMNLPDNYYELTTSSRFINPTIKHLKMLIPEGSIVFPKRGGAIATNKKRYVNKSIFVDLNIMATTPHKPLSINYVMLWLDGIDLASLNTGTSVPQINNKDIEPLYFPLPPLAEQKRIVAKVDSLMALCDELEKKQQEKAEKKLALNKASLHALNNSTTKQDFNKNWSHITNNFDLLYSTTKNVDDLKQTILQLAVQGKLVPQNPNDEPASVLLEKIKAEKEQLIKDGKIKKQKPLKPIDDSEIPFDIPEGWEWTKLESLCEYIQRGKGPKYVDQSNIPVISQKCVQWTGFDISRARFIDEKSLEKYTPERFLKDNDLLWNSTGTGTIGRINVFELSNTIFDKVVADSHVTVIRPTIINSKFLCNYLTSPTVQDGFEERASGTTNQIELNTTVVKNYLIPLPPLNEQIRIVAKVDALMKLCDTLTKDLAEKENKAEKLLNAVVGQI